MCCVKNCPVVDWEILVKAGREPEVKRTMEFELYDEVSEDLTKGKRV